MISSGTPKAKAPFWLITDTEIRKLGERSRLETCVFLALNACLLDVPLAKSKTFCRRFCEWGVAKLTR